MLRCWVLISFFAVSSILQAETITVESDGSGDHNSIQSAVDVAQNGDLILVGPGIYESNRSLTFSGKAITLRSTQGPNRTTIQLFDSPAHFLDRFSVVIFNRGEGPESVLEGFTIRQGRGTKASSLSLANGGGILCTSSSSPTIKNCTIRDNEVEGSGGGISCEVGSSPKIIDCEIVVNRARSGDGGGIFCSRSSSPEIINCKIRSNAAGNNGGGISCTRDSSPIISNCSILNNIGSGIQCLSGSSPHVDRCEIAGNTAAFGGGIHISRSSPTFSNCKITDNKAELGDLGGGLGGGVYSFSSAPYLENSLIVRNSGLFGGGFNFRSSTGATVLNCTVAGNNVSRAGGGFLVNDSTVRIHNSIIWGNLEGSIELELEALADITHSCIESNENWLGGGNIDEDPLFVDEESYRLQPDSPAIDAGNSSTAPSQDLDGMARPCGNEADMGAWEHCEDINPNTAFLRGETNEDGDLNVSDAVAILIYLFTDREILNCVNSADIDDDGQVLLNDPIRLLEYLFLSGEPPQAPFKSCGFDPTPGGELTCVSQVNCN